MDRYEESGRRLQYGVIQDETGALARGDDHYSPAEVAQATVHTRQDLVLVIAQLLAIRRLLRWLVRLAGVGLLLAIYALVR